MAGVYVHFSGGDVEREMPGKAGVVATASEEDSPLLPRECPRCRHRNPHDAMYCTMGSMALDNKAALKIGESIGAAKVSPEYGAIPEALKRDVGIAK